MTTADLPPLGTMTTQVKRELLAALVRDLAVETGPLSVVADGREYFVYEVPVNARARAAAAAASAAPDEWAELDRRAASPERSFGHDEALNPSATPRSRE